MSIVPIVTARILTKALLKAGFKIVRQAGSHIRLQHITDSRRYATIPYHAKDIPRWLLKEILKQARLSIDELKYLLKK